MEVLFENLIQNGVPRETVVTLLMFPLIASIIVAARQIIGIKGFGIYTPLIITLAFLQSGFKYGAFIFVFALIISSTVRWILKTFRMLYLPKMALILSITALSFYPVLYVGTLTNSTMFIQTSVYILLIIITLIEKFISVQLEKGFRRALTMSIETFILSSIGYFIVSWPYFQALIFGNPALILVFFVIIIFLGQYDGLRLKEYFRFRHLLRNL